jgi:fibronectin type 3 domain-containing protein
MENRQFIRWSLAAVASLLGLTLLGAPMACGGGSSPSAASATLTWTGPASAAVTGYRVYYGLASGSYLQAKGAGIAVGPVETYVVTGLSAGNRYYFAVTAVDASNNESAYSNEASKVVE